MKPAANAGGLFVAPHWPQAVIAASGTSRAYAIAMDPSLLKVWRDEPCGCPQSALDPDGPPNGAHPMWEPGCARCNNTGRILGPAE